MKYVSGIAQYPADDAERLKRKIYVGHQEHSKNRVIKRSILW